MAMKHALKFATISLIFVSIGIQAYILLVLLIELVTMGHTGVASAFGYGASLVFSIPAYLVAIALIHATKTKLPAKWIHGSYLGSHLVILACMLAVPGQFT